MTDRKIIMTMGAKQALGGQFSASVTVDVKIRRTFIWAMKLRAI
jgi:hypothetical protein